MGWVRVLPRQAHPGLAGSRFFRTELAVDGIWSISCFVVRAKWRRLALTTLLARAAVDHARENGARGVEAYPTETDARQPAGAVYLGVASTFRRLGFEEVQRKAPHKPMMRLSLD